MVRAKTTAQWISDFRGTHGDRFAYPVDTNEPFRSKKIIEIVCPVHGPFQQTCAQHVKGDGCSACSGRRPHDHGEWINRFTATHGDRYDYAKSLPVAGNRKITITCSIHGNFEQTPHSHWKGSGCAKCAGVAPISTEQWIERFKATHGDRFDYSITVIEGTMIPTKIVCRLHGEFLQRPHSHAQGAVGCPGCSPTVKKDAAAWVAAFRKRHGDSYDYSDVIDPLTPGDAVTIICHEHGKFKQLPAMHAFQTGCPRCAGRYVRTASEWKHAFDKKHDAAYCYRSLPSTSADKVEIECAEGHVFHIRANDHLRGIGCAACSDKKRRTTEEWLTIFKRVHENGMYDYSKFHAVNTYTKAIIICARGHGEFKQSPSHHSRGHGCPQCAPKISKKSQDWLDHLGVETREFRVPETRWFVDGYDPIGKIVYEFYGDFWHGHPRRYPPDQMNWISGKTFKQLYEKTIAREDRLKHLGYTVVSIWERDWDIFKKENY